MIKIPKFPGVYYRISEKRILSYFYKSDFLKGHDIDELCKEIRRSGVTNLPETHKDPLTWLNLCLGNPGLYDGLLSSSKDFKVSSTTKKLARDTAAIRAKPFDSLGSEDQEKILDLNRRTLEDLLPGKVPKRSEPRHAKDDRCFYVTYKKGSGKVYEKVGWTSEGYSAQVASGIRAERIRSLRHGDEIPNKKNKTVTFGEAWDRYDKWLDTGKKHTADDRNRYENHLKKRFSQTPLSHISSRDVETLKDALLKTSLAPATVKHVLALMRQIINKAIKWHLWEGKNPVTEVELPRLNNKRVRFLTPDETKKLLSLLAETSPQLHDMALVSLHTGMRAGELFGLKVSDLDFVNGTIYISNPKSGEPRHIFMTPQVKAILLPRNVGEPGELIFKSRKGGAVKEISNAFESVVRKLGFNEGVADPRQKVCFHSLRHTFASWLAIKGTPIFTIKELLGHKSLTMTERYAHLTPDTKREALKNIEATLNETK